MRYVWGTAYTCLLLIFGWRDSLSWPNFLMALTWERLAFPSSPVALQQKGCDLQPQALSLVSPGTEVGRSVRQQRPGFFQRVVWLFLNCQLPPGYDEMGALSPVGCLGFCYSWVSTEPKIKTRSFEKWYVMSSESSISIKTTRLVKILPSQGQALALFRMIMALSQTNSFKANTQILTKVDTVQKLGLFGNAEE